MRRRTFLLTAAGAATSAAAQSSSLGARAGALPLRARPFELTRIRLRPGIFLDCAEVNRRYLLSLDPDRLPHMFRLTAGLPSSAQPLGGWEQPANELRGHFTGHYLSACALSHASLGDEELKRRGLSVVAELGKCQKAVGNGYLSAFPEEFFDRLRAGLPVWAPFYTLHKIMAGLLDMYRYCGSAQALDILRGMAAGSSACAALWEMRTWPACWKSSTAA